MNMISSEMTFSGTNLTDAMKARNGAAPKQVAGYAKSVKLFAEGLKTSKRINHKTDFVSIMNAGGDFAQLYKEGLMKPLLADRDRISAEYNKASLEKKFLWKEQLDQAERDIGFIGGRMDTTMKLFSEMSGSNDLKPNQQTLLPLQYLETIQNNSRLVIPYENTEVRTMSRQRVRKEIIVDGQKYTLPDAYLDPVLMEKILNQDALQKEFTIPANSGNFDIVAAYGADATKGKDKLNPILKLTKIILVGGAVIKIPQTNDTQATWKSRGKFSIMVQDIAPSTNKYHVSGEVDFREGVMTFLTTAGVSSVVVEASLSGGSFTRTFTANERREDHEFVVDKQMSSQYTYNMLDLHDKLTLENVDGVMSATGIIYETAVNAKDYYAFNELKKYKTSLDDGAYLTGLYQDNDVYDHVVDLNPTNGNNSLFRPTGPRSWREELIPEGMSKLAYDFGMKLESREGFQTIFWAQPMTTRLVDKMDVILTEGTEYGGVVADTTVMVGAVQGKPVKVVTTRRADKHTIVADKGEVHSLLALPISNAENEETFKFYQYFTMFDTEGKYRSPLDMISPTITYLDLFKMEALYIIMGELKLTGANYANY